jgi:hypothetical protein
LRQDLEDVWGIGTIAAADIRIAAKDHAIAINDTGGRSRTIPTREQIGAWIHQDRIDRHLGTGRIAGGPPNFSAAGCMP